MLPVAGVGVSAPVLPASLGASANPTTPASGPGSFLSQVQAMTDNTNALAGQVATGQLQDVGQFTAAAAESSLAVSLTASLRNKAVEAYNSIMSMQV